MAKEIDITINPDGTIDFDQLGWEDKSCDGAIDDLIRAIGKETSSKKKAEWRKKVQIKQQQKWKQ